MKEIIAGAVIGALLGATAAHIQNTYTPARDGLIYACGFLAGTFAMISDETADKTERKSCVRWRERAESVGFIVNK